MEKEEAINWMRLKVSDLFMEFLCYDRDEEMNTIKLRKLMDEGVISKKDMIEVFISQIEKEY